MAKVLRYAGHVQWSQTLKMGRVLLWIWQAATARHAMVASHRFATHRPEPLGCCFRQRKTPLSSPEQPGNAFRHSGRNGMPTTRLSGEIRAVLQFSRETTGSWYKTSYDLLRYLVSSSIARDRQPCEWIFAVGPEEGFPHPNCRFHWQHSRP